MPDRYVHVTGIDGWIDGLDRLSRGVGEHQVAEWRYATERFYDHTQRFAHVLSGDMKASGRFALDPRGQQIEGSVTYGGTPDCDYAVYEMLGRGGEHNALQRGYLANIDAFEQALVDGIAAEIDGWG